MEQTRMVAVPGGTIIYILQKKRIRNLNLRLNDRGEVLLSVPYRCPEEDADAFVREKGRWILRRLAQWAEQEKQELLPKMDRGEACVMLRQALERVYPLISPYGVAMPALKVRQMQSQWGNCHWKQGYITLNLALHRCPAHLREYVALHELVHFLHPDHSAAFYATMDVLMPDWKKRRKELKGYAGAIRSGEE